MAQVHKRRVRLYVVCNGVWWIGFPSFWGSRFVPLFHYHIWYTWYIIPLIRHLWSFHRPFSNRPLAQAPRGRPRSPPRRGRRRSMAATCTGGQALVGWGGWPWHGIQSHGDSLGWIFQHLWMVMYPRWWFFKLNIADLSEIWELNWWKCKIL